MKRILIVSCVLYTLQNKCVPYWPEVDAYKEVGPYVVTCLSETDASDYKVRVLEMAPLNEVTKTRHNPQTHLHLSPCTLLSE